MDDDICGNFDFLRMYLHDDLEKSTLDFHKNDNIKKYCSNDGSGEKKCNTDLDKIKAGFLWLLEKNCSISKKTYSDESINAIFLYIISWLSYKLNQNSEHYFTKINDFFTEYVNNNQEYDKIIQNSQGCKNLKEIINKKSDLLNIDIQDMSNFYDVFKSLCNIYGDVAKNTNNTNLSASATIFVNKYTNLNDYYNIENTSYSKILSNILTYYNKLKNKCAERITDPVQLPSLPTGRATKKFLRNSSIQISLIPMTFIFFALLIYLGIVYKRSSFDFRKKLQKLNLRIKKIKRKINH
ncbi:PIR protein [Plasmodium yoelii]|nr:PIR protein [Plasmodium yoelii]CDU15991.1 YIR protein [Plasmodium yoelii]VTZ71586.1 PIR protein [Plasmodium yoelii]|eukprot:XP_022811289.1 PIR protein [Plasmodium yoelii]